MKLLVLLLDFSAIATLLLAVATAYVVYQVFFSPLAAFPGPFWAKVTYWYWAWRSMRGQAHRDLVDLHQRYGSVVRLGPDYLSVADPKVFREIYKEAGGKFRKSAVHDTITGTRPFDLLAQRDEKIHSAQRRLVASAYTMDSMVHLEPLVDSLIVSTMEKLSTLPGDIDLGVWIQLFAFDVIGAISFSWPFGFIEAGDDGGIFKRMQNSLSSISWLMYVDWFYSLHQRLMPVIGNWLAANDRNGHFFNFARQEITARKDRAGDTKDMASQLFTVQQTKTELDDTNIAFMMASNVLAGSDTASTSARAVIYLLLKNPRSLQRLLDEIEERKSDGRLSYPVKFQEAESWPYLQAVMYEAMRLYPAVGRNLDRDVPAGGLQIGDHWVPEGTMVGSTAWAIHRIPEIWGPDVEDFRPERGLDEEKVGDLNISWLEISKFVPTLFMRFDVDLVPGTALEEFCG
ncbi:hypothetical protein HFD88_005976 [Aspergillus terreus]|nr:hypothetical protein HFD88_005976 [Aspergillus terreus]